MRGDFFRRAKQFGTLGKRYGVVGGPADYLETCDLHSDLYDGVYAFNYEASVALGVLSIVLFCAIEHHAGPFPKPPPGYEIRRAQIYASDALGPSAEAEIVFTWVQHESLYVPPHWLTLGIERCLAMHRILGSDERRWPALETMG